MKVYNVPTNSPVGQLINNIEKMAKEKGLNFSRWQANGGGHTTTVNYAVHSGERAGKAADQTGVVASFSMPLLEGHTEKCTAHKMLSRMFETLKKTDSNGTQNENT